MKKTAIILVVFALATGMGYFMLNSVRKAPVFVSENPAEGYEADRVVAEVIGAVWEPGEYSVIKGTSLHDVLHFAGGVKQNADLSELDFDTFVCENCRIFVPEKSAKAEKVKEIPIDLNSATAEDLTALPGIGDKMALKIINYRNLHGKFQSTDELMNVNGIGKNKYEAIKDMITVGGNL